ARSGAEAARQAAAEAAVQTAAEAARTGNVITTNNSVPPTRNSSRSPFVGTSAEVTPDTPSLITIQEPAPGAGFGATIRSIEIDGQRFDLEDTPGQKPQ